MDINSSRFFNLSNSSNDIVDLFAYLYSVDRDCALDRLVKDYYCVVFNIPVDDIDGSLYFYSLEDFKRMFYKAGDE